MFARRRPRSGCGLDAASLSLYADGGLDTPAAARVQAHLGGCKGCRRELEDLRRLSALLGDALATPPRTAVERAGALARAKARIRRRPSRVAWWEFPASRLPVLGAALLAVLSLAEAFRLSGLEEQALALALSFGLF